MEDVPSVRLVSSLDVLSEGDGGVTVNGDVVVIVDGNEVSELQVTKIRIDSLAELTTYPAREQASEETPSWRQPSPRKT